MTKRTAYIFRTLVAATFMFAFGITLRANGFHLDKTYSGFNNNFFQKTDTTPSTDTSRYPISDRRGDPYTYPNRNTFDLKDTSFIKRSIIYDPKTKQYYIVEKIGTQYYRDRKSTR